MNRFGAKFNHWMGFELGSEQVLSSGYLKHKVGRKAWLRLRRRGLVASPAPPGSSLLTAVMGGGIENMRGGRLTIRGDRTFMIFDAIYDALGASLGLGIVGWVEVL